MENLEMMYRKARSIGKAAREIGSTVVRQNPDTLEEVKNILMNGREPRLVGIKNTGQIGRNYLRRLVQSGEYVWHTVDAMAERGRAVDHRLRNPLTGRMMTGSSSGTALNVFWGMNDIGIGTDGGGSVLAPAMALNLPGVMGKGLGLRGQKNRLSTDGLSFVPGLGVIGQSFAEAARTIRIMADLEADCSEYFGTVRVMLPEPGSIILPDGRDMYEALRGVRAILSQWGVDTSTGELPDGQNRQDSIRKTEEILESYDLIITREGPVDLFSYGDSVSGSFGLPAGRGPENSGKYLMRIANMVDGTAAVIPSDELGTGVVLLSRPGSQAGLSMLAFAERLAEELPPLPSLPERYFREGGDGQNELLFSLED